MTPYLLVYLGLAWIGGIALARYVSQPIWAWLALSGLSIFGLILTRDDRRLRVPLVCALAFSLGAARYQGAQPTPGDPKFIATYNDRGEVTLEGVVVGEPDVRERHVNLRLRVDTLLTHGDDDTVRKVRGVVLVQAPRFPVFGYGDRLRVFGTLETPPVFEDFSYREFLARQSVYSLLRFGRTTLIASRQCAFGSDDFSRPATEVATTSGVSSDDFSRPATTVATTSGWDWNCNPFFQAIFDFKTKALAVVAAIFPEPQASLLSGILLGVEYGIPQSLKDAFSATGTSHIVAISGFNITLVAGVFVFLSERLAGRRRGAYLAIAGIVLYTLLVGASASVVRAAIMGSMVLLARLIGRQVFGPGALFGAAIVMTALNPLTLWDVGFQLSFFATLGLILYAEPFAAAFVRFVARFTPMEVAEKTVGFVSEFFILTLAAQITTLPLIAYYFRRVSLVSFLANFLVLPAQPAVMILGGAATIAGLLSLPLGSLAAWVAWPFVTYTIAVIELLARVPGASVELGRFSFGALVGMYGLLFGLTWLNGQTPEKRPQWLEEFARGWGANALLGLMALATVVVWSGVFALPDGRLHVTFLDVGQGDAILIETPSGEHVLIDGGPGAGTLAEALGRRMPFWKRNLALVVVAAPEDKHIAGLAGALPRYAIDSALVAGAAGKSAAYRELVDLLNTRSVPVVAAAAGQAFDLGDGARLDVVAAGEAGATLRLAMRNASFLLPIGLTGEDIVAFVSDPTGGAVSSSVLLVPDNGSGGALADGLAQRVSPWAAVISVGAGNRDGDPAPDTLAALKGYTVLRTDERGWVSFATDGEKLWAETER